MRRAGSLMISTHDLVFTDMESSHFSQWNTGPSSPAFINPSPFQLLPPLDSSIMPTSPLTEFEFKVDPLCSLQVQDDLALSPKLITSSAVTPRFKGAAAAPTPTTAHVCLLDPPPPILTVQRILPPPHELSSQPIAPNQQPAAPPSPSVRQLLTEEISSNHDDDLHLSFYSASSTPLWTPPRKSNPKQSSLSQDEPFLSTKSHNTERRKSNDALLDKQPYDEFAQLQYKKQVLQSSKSDNATSSSAWEKNEEIEKSGAAMKKQGGKISMKWAFKDLLRKTVPSSRAEAQYITNTMGASASKTHLPSTTKSNPNLSPFPSPMHSSSYMFTPQTSQPKTPLVHSSSSPARSPLRHPTSPRRSSTRTLNQSPMPSPPRSPLSPHAIHYQQNKAHSTELSKKTFLPYRQSLLGCLSASSVFLPEQQA